MVASLLGITTTMKCKILYKSKNRLRVHLFHNNMSLEEADIIEY